MSEHDLIECVELVPNTIYFDSNTDEFTNLTPIIVNGNTRIVESNKFCGYEKELFDILKSPKFGKFNITYLKEIGDQSKFMESKGIDLILSPTTIEEWLISYAKSPWTRQETNIQILSALYPQPRSLFRHLNITFSQIVWLLILESILAVTVMVYVIGKFQTNGKLKEKYRRDRSLVEAFILTCSYLVNYGSNKNDSLLINIWSFASLILISCFSGNVLSSLVNQDMKSIDSFKELAETNLTIMSGNSSYFQYINKTLTINNILTQLNDRALFVEDYDLKVKDYIIKEVSDRKAAYLREGFYISSLKNQNPHRPTAIASEGYLPVLIGYPINKIMNRAREQIYNIIKRTVEVGIINRWTLRYIMNDKIIGANNARNASKDNNHISDFRNNSIIITIEMLRDLFILLGFGYIFSLLTFLIEFCKIYLDICTPFNAFTKKFFQNKIDFSLINTN